MRITAARADLFAWKPMAPLAYGGGVANATGASDVALLTIEAGAHEGHAFLGSPMRPGSLDLPALRRDVLSGLVGQDALAREAIHARLSAWARGTFGWRVLGAVDVALWDLLGKAANLPLHRLLGGARTSIPAYASGQKQPDTAAYAAQARAARTAGYAGYKLHPPGDPARDVEACKAARDAVGPDFPLMLDAGFAYDYPNALRVGRAAERLGFLWLEDPLDAHDIAHAAELRARLDIPVMATEQSPGGLTAYTPWVAARATDWLRGDTALKGGLTPLVKAAGMAEAFGLRFAVHHGGNSVHNLAGLHLALAAPAADWFEVLLPEETHRFGLVKEPTLAPDGTIAPPDGPGLGAVPDLAALGAPIG